MLLSCVWLICIYPRFNGFINGERLKQNIIFNEKEGQCMCSWSHFKTTFTLLDVKLRKFWEDVGSTENKSFGFHDRKSQFTVYKRIPLCAVLQLSIVNLICCSFQLEFINNQNVVYIFGVFLRMNDEFFVTGNRDHYFWLVKRQLYPLFFNMWSNLKRCLWQTQGMHAPFVQFLSFSCSLEERLGQVIGCPPLGMGIFSI